MPDLRVFTLVVILLFTGVAVASTSYAEHAYERENVSADVNVSHDVWIDLPGEELASTTVTDENGTALTEGDDYSLDGEGGRIQFSGSGNTSEGDIVTAEYEARLANDLAQSFAGNQSSMFGGAAVIAVVLAIAAALVALVSMTRTRRGWGLS